jgi:hypothetical protein
MSTQTTPDPDPISEIWQLFKETSERFKETDARLDQRFRETSERFKETDARLDQRFRETSERFRETDEQLRRLEDLFGGKQWGRLMEALVRPNVLQLFQARGRQVRRLHQRSKAQLNGHTLEVDLILENGAEVLVVEVKSTLGVDDVNDFLHDLTEFTTFFPIYRDYAIYGAVAALSFAEEADRYAYRRGLYVVQVVGEGNARILNDDNFRPRDFAGPRASSISEE